MVRDSIVCGILVAIGCGSEGGRTNASDSGALSVGSAEGGSASASTGETDDFTDDGGTDAGSADDAADSDDEGTVFDLGTPADVATEECVPPDVLVVLDRTQSMHKRPDNSTPPDNAMGWAESKWGIAVPTIEAFVGTYEDTVRFGLELFPRDPGGNACKTLSQVITGASATNPECQGGELVVAPVELGAAAIDAVLDTTTTKLCISTPVAAALETAATELAAIVQADRPQYVLLITDGKDTCQGGQVVPAAQALAAAGVLVYVVSFGIAGDDGIDPAQLNDLACAGQTAVDFAMNCMDEGGGNYVAVDPANGPTLYIPSNDMQALEDALAGIVGQVCCGCVG
jgi:hypothetical protein